MSKIFNAIVAAVIVVSATVLVRSQAGLTANAGPDQNNAVVGAAVALNGAGSTGATSYTWTFTSRPQGSAAALSGATTVAASFTPDRGGIYVVRLTVGNGVTTASDTVSVVTVNRAPEADAGPDLAAAVGKAVTLDGTGSFDPDADKVTYAWSVVDAPAASVRQLTNVAKSKGRLLIDRAGTYVVQLVVRDGELTSVADQAIVTTTNSAPLANAGPDRVVSISTPAQLDGTASSDVDGDAITYTWKLKRPSGSGAILSDASSPRPTLIPDLAGVYTATLTVSDGTLKKADSVTLTTNTNLAPVARTGADHAALLAGQSILLDGGASTDANGDRLGYSWTIVKRPGASTAALVTPNSVRTAFVADVKGNYTFRLAVTDGSGASSVDDVVYSAAQPVADAGPDQHALAGATVMLDGSGSSHLSGLLRYGWSLLSVPSGSAAALSDPTDPEPQITVDLPGLYVAQLTVFDGLVLSPADVAVVTVSQNSVPRVELGPDRVVAVNTIVTVDGAAASDVDPGALTLQWSLLARPATSAAAVSSPGAASTQVTIDRPGAYVVQLVAVDHDGLLAAGTLMITTSGGRPSVSVGPDRAVSAGTPVALLASAADPDGAALTFAWRLLLQPDDSGAAISGPASATATLTPDVPGVYVAQLVTTDADHLEALDAIVLRATEATVPVITIAATDASASEAGTNPGTFTFTRSGDVTAALSGVSYARTGSAAGADFSPALPLSGTVAFAAGQATTTITITPVDDAANEGAETVVLTLVDGAAYDLGAPASQTATVTIADNDGGNVLTNGGMHVGAINAAGQVETWTFSATAGDRIAVHLGEIVDSSDFRPRIQLKSPSGSVIADNNGVEATAVEAVAPGSGVFSVLVFSWDTGLDGTGTYRLTMTHTPGPIVVSAGDDGGPLTNGAMHAGEIVQGDLDVWTFTATAGERIALHIGETADFDEFRPWVRLWAPNGANVAESNGVKATALEAVAPMSGTYLVLVASWDSGYDGTGTYRLAMTKTPGPITVSPGDQGGPLTNGAIHTGEIVQGDVDVWTFTANAGERIALHIGENIDNDEFRPWMRLWAPNGANVAESNGVEATALEAVAPMSGTYLVLVASWDSGYDGTGTYRLTMTKTPGPITVSPGDQGGPLTNGAIHTGEIVQGDVDVWTFTANAGERIALHIGENIDNDEFRPWMRLWAPNGANVAESNGVEATALEAVAPMSGTYLVLVASWDSGYDGTGTYRLAMTKTPGPITVSPGDQGGPLTNGAIHIGEIVQGDVDVWTFTATAGERIALHIGETADFDEFRPWLRLWSPTGASLAQSNGLEATALEAVAPATGTYLVLVASWDSGYDGTGTYQLTLAKTPGPITVSAGDQGGALTSGVAQGGTITQGDVDAWTITAVAGQHLSAVVSQVSETDDFAPWIRVWAPNGAQVAETWGPNGGAVGPVVAPVTGTYIVLVASADSGYDGTGTYSVSVSVGP